MISFSHIVQLFDNHLEAVKYFHIQINVLTVTQAVTSYITFTGELRGHQLKP